MKSKHASDGFTVQFPLDCDSINGEFDFLPRDRIFNYQGREAALFGYYVGEVICVYQGGYHPSAGDNENEGYWVTLVSPVLDFQGPRPKYVVGVFEATGKPPVLFGGERIESPKLDSQLLQKGRSCFANQELLDTRFIINCFGGTRIEPLLDGNKVLLSYADNGVTVEGFDMQSPSGESVLNGGGNKVYPPVAVMDAAEEIRMWSVQWEEKVGCTMVPWFFVWMRSESLIAGGLVLGELEQSGRGAGPVTPAQRAGVFAAENNFMGQD
ncbi:MAG: hypothetical protein AAGD01_17460 [Acidobacteriota bacterium]